MNYPICEDLDEKIQYTQNLLKHYLDHIKYNEERINYLIFVGVNKLGRRPDEEHLAVVQELHHLYINHLSHLEHIRFVTHQFYHST